MRLILVGPPGCGKGTQAKLLHERLGLEHISTGDMFRQAIRRETPVGKKVEAIVSQGQLVPDDLVNELVAERFVQQRPERFVLDGYPRTRAQAAAFDQLLRQQSLTLTGVILFQVAEDEIVRRLSGRWSCSDCTKTYHVDSNPPRSEGICDACGSALFQRPDDSPETVRRRLAVYRDSTADMIAYYRVQNLLCEVSGAGTIDQIYQEILKALNKQAGRPC